MTLKITLLLFLLISIEGYSQRQRATLILRNGDTITGLAKIQSDGDVKFKLNTDSKKQIFNYRNLDKIFINETGTTTRYRYKILEDKITRPRLMEIISEGKLSLYRINVSGVAYTGFGAHNGFNVISHGYSINNYFVGDGDKVKRLTSTGVLFDKNFRNTASEYFKDCPALVELINKKELKKNDLEEIVRYYNEQCDSIL